MLLYINNELKILSSMFNKYFYNFCDLLNDTNHLLINHNIIGNDRNFIFNNFGIYQ